MNMKRIVSLLMVFSIILSSFNFSFAEDEIIISGLYPIKGDKIRLMSFESNLDFETFVQDEEYIFKNESDKSQNIEIGLNKDNGIRLPKVKVADQEIQLREEKDKYSFNIDLDKGEYKKVELSYEVRVNNANEDNIEYKTEGLCSWYKDIVEFKMIYDIQEYIYPEVDVYSYSMRASYDNFNRFIIYDNNFFEGDSINIDISNRFKNDKEIQEIRELGNNGQYIEAMNKMMGKYVNSEAGDDYKKTNLYYSYMTYLAAEYYISDLCDEDYPKNKLAEIFAQKANPNSDFEYFFELNMVRDIATISENEKEQLPLEGKVILLNVEKQPQEAWVDYDDRDREQEIKAKYKEELNRLSNEVEELAPNSGIYVPKLDKYDIVAETGMDEYRIWNEYDTNRGIALDLKYQLEELGASVIVNSYNSNGQIQSNIERIKIANENDVYMVITIGTELNESKGNYIVCPSFKYMQDSKLYNICNELAQYMDEALIAGETEYTAKRIEKQITENKTLFNWSDYPIVGIKLNSDSSWNFIYEIKTKLVEYFNDKDVQAYYTSHPRELEKQELELVKEKLKTGNKVTENEVIAEVEMNNTMKNNSVLMIVSISVVATTVAAILTFVVIKLIKRIRRKNDEQKENSSDSE